MQKDLKKTVKDLTINLKDKNKVLDELKKENTHVRYSGEMNSSIFEILSEIGFVITNAYKKRRITNSIEHTEKAINEKIPILEEIEKEIEKIKKQYEKSFNLNDGEDELNRDIDTFKKIRMLYEQLDNLSITSPQYKNIVDDFQSKLLEPDIKDDEIKSYMYVQVEKIENDSDRKMVSSLFEALISEVFKDEALEDVKSSTVSNKSIRIDIEEDVNLKRDVQRYRR